MGGPALVDVATRAGLVALGVAGAGVFADTRRHLVERRAAGLAGGMQFTFRNPERSTDPGRIVPGARSLVVGALAYAHPTPPAAPAPGPTPGACRQPVGQVAAVASADHYGALRRALAEVASLLSGAGWRAVVVADENSLVDRAAARRAGLGWFGRNSLLLVRGAGSWCVLGSVVTDAPLTPGPLFLPRPAGGRPVPVPEPHAAGCGRCTRCLEACPTGALVAPGVVDARRCLAWVLQAPGPVPARLRAAAGTRLYGCDDCQVTCPVNLTADRHHPASAPSGAGRGTGPGPEVDLLGVLGATDGELLDRFGRWYLPGRDPGVLRRNALVALGNAGVGTAAVRAAIARYEAGDDQLLAEHARWARARLDDVAAGRPAGERGGVPG